MYISIKSTTFFETQSFMVPELQLSNFLQYNGFVFCSYFKWRHNRSYWKIRLTPVKGIHVNNGESVCAIASHKIHVLMKFIEIDETYVNLLHNYSKSDPQKPQKFQSSQETLHWCFDPCYQILLMHICAYTCICWLFQFAYSAYCSLYKWWFAAFHLSRVGTILC